MTSIPTQPPTGYKKCMSLNTHKTILAPPLQCIMCNKNGIRMEKIQGYLIVVIQRTDFFFGRQFYYHVF